MLQILFPDFQLFSFVFMKLGLGVGGLQLTVSRLSTAIDVDSAQNPAER